jgi:hypothetical protein
VHTPHRSSHLPATDTRPPLACTLRRAAALDIKDRVVEGGRPHVPTATPNAVAGLIRAAWDGDGTRRPTFEAIASSLRDVEDSMPMGAAALGVAMPADALDALLK